MLSTNMKVSVNEQNYKSFIYNFAPTFISIKMHLIIYSGLFSPGAIHPILYSF